VSLVGTFALFPLFGYLHSTPLIALRAWVLASGRPVDDAIVVVRGVEHHIEHGMARRKRALKRWRRVGPVIAIAIILSARVHLRPPSSRITGRLYRSSP